MNLLIIDWRFNRPRTCGRSGQNGRSGQSGLSILARPSIITLLEALGGIILPGSTQCLNVQNILFPSSRQFISYEIVPGYHRGSNLAINNSLDAVLPCLIEGNAVDVLQNVD